MRNAQGRAARSSQRQDREGKVKRRLNGRTLALLAGAAVGIVTLGGNVSGVSPASAIGGGDGFHDTAYDNIGPSRRITSPAPRQ
jgi:hypothetical protein